MKTTPGIILTEHNSDYHANSCVSWSSLKVFIENPRLYQKKYILKEVQEDHSDALRLGSAFHYLMEGENTFYKNCKVFEDGFSLRSSKNKERWNNCIDGGITPLKSDEMNSIMSWKSSVMKNKFACALLRKGKAEVTFRLNGSPFGMQCRTDWYCDAAPDFEVEHGIFDAWLPDAGEPYAVDLKTSNAPLSTWLSGGYNCPIHTYGYHRQEAFYRLVINEIRKRANLPPIEKFYFIVVEKKEPNECAVIKLSPELYEISQRHVSDAVNRLRRAYIDGDFGGYEKQLHVAKLLDCVLRSEEEDL